MAAPTRSPLRCVRLPEAADTSRRASLPVQNDQTPPPTTARLWEIDVARGVAVVLMIFFHLMWDLQFLGLSDVNVFSTPWQAFARGIGSSFAFLMGLSLALVGARLRSSATLWHYALRRGGLIFGLGMLITLATYLALGDQYVRFGILHLLGSMLVLAAPLMFAPAWAAFVVGVAMIILGVLLSGQTIAGPWLLWLGVQQVGVAMADYYPLLPWGGPMVLGVAVGQWVYPGGVRRRALPDLAPAAPVRGLALLGRHSLLIYLVHQPILLAILFGLRRWLVSEGS